MLKKIAGVILVLQIFSAVHAQIAVEINDVVEYDVGCYKASKDFNRGGHTEFMRRLEDGGTLPNCIKGGVWRNVQCKLSYCFCAYGDTGNRNGMLSTSDHSYNSLKIMCPKEAEYKANACVSPPFHYNCNLTVPKFHYNPQSSQCELSSVGCYGFLSVSECEQSCAKVVVVFEVDKHSDGLLSMPLWIVRKYNLNQTNNQVNASEFFGYVELGAELLELVTREEPTTAITTTTTTTTMFVPGEGSGDDGCSEPVQIGPCRAYFPRWYFNEMESRCYGFLYGGCLGNENNFKTAASCAARCGAKNAPTVRFNTTTLDFEPIL